MGNAPTIQELRGLGLCVLPLAKARTTTEEREPPLREVDVTWQHLEELAVRIDKITARCPKLGGRSFLWAATGNTIGCNQCGKKIRCKKLHRRWDRLQQILLEREG